MAEGKEAELLAFIDSKKGRTIDFASDGFIRDEAARIADVRDPDNIFIRYESEALNTHLKVNKQPLDRDIYEIHVFDLEGRIIATTEDDGEEMGSYKDKNQPHFLRGRKETYVQDVHFYGHKGAEEAVIAIGTPLKSRTSGRVVGVLMNRYRLENIKDILIGKRALQLGAPTTLNISETAIDIFLVNQEGLMILPSKDMADFKPLKHKMDAIEAVFRCINAGRR